VPLDNGILQTGALIRFIGFFERKTEELPSRREHAAIAPIRGCAVDAQNTHDQIRSTTFLCASKSASM
jgi:hypothetical protein